MFAYPGLIQRQSAAPPGLLPDVVIDRLELPTGALYVAREDLLPGGTKQRAITPFLEDLWNSGIRHVVYASPFCGFAQVALSVAAQHLGMPVTLYCERDVSAGSSKPVLHAFSELAQSFGANVHLVDSLEVAEFMARRFCREQPQAFQIPLGFREPRYLDLMAKQVREQYQLICQRLEGEPRRIWLPVGSGTLADIFLRVVSPETDLLCVDVRILDAADERLRALKRSPNLTLFRAQECFAEPSASLPPLPSNLHYDAKLWSWITRHGQAGDLWWNVAR